VDLPPIKRVVVPADLLAEVRDEWIAHSLSTEAADREAAEAGVRAAYRKAELEPPRTILWLGSPFAGVLGSYFLDVQLNGRNGRLDVPDWSPYLTGRVGGRTGLHPSGDEWVTFHAGGESLAEQVSAQVRPTWNMITLHVFRQLEDLAWHPFGDQVEDQLRAVMADRLGTRSLREIWAAEEPVEVRDRIRHQDATAVDGLRDAGHLADHDLNRRRRRKSDPRLRNQLRVARSAGRWWPMDDVVILTERPTELHRDDQARPHCAHGPAIRYPDGWSVYAWHGVWVPPDLIEGAGWTAERMKSETNSVLRRCAGEWHAAAKDRPA
jgi:hypothetical protein